MNDLLTDLLDEQLMLRISAEYAEMPGLRLTIPQAQRLFGLGERLCARLLEELVERRYLVRNPAGVYVRLTAGPAGPLLPRRRSQPDHLEQTA